jgi:hypothetical protein
MEMGALPESLGLQVGTEGPGLFRSTSLTTSPSSAAGWHEPDHNLQQR